MEKIKINNEEYILDVEKAEELGLLKKEKAIPKTWEEFCNHNYKKGECYIDISGKIEEVMPGGTRYSCDKNIIPDRQTAEAMLALCQLIQLRDCYNDGWKPNWRDSMPKFVITYYNDEIRTPKYYNNSYVLAFKEEVLRDKFLSNYKDLIEIAKPLL